MPTVIFIYYHIIGHSDEERKTPLLLIVQDFDLIAEDFIYNLVNQKEYVHAFRKQTLQEFSENACISTSYKK